MTGQRAPHLLYVAWGFPPCRSGGVYRALATVNAFARAGWRVTVLTADRETFERHTGTDPSMEERIDPSVRVVRVPFEWPTHDPDLRRWGWLRARSPRLWRRYRNLRDRVTFPEIGYGPWRLPLERAALAVHAADPVDLTVASANPNVDFSPARKLFTAHGVPYVMDYRDAWLLDVFSGDQLLPDSSLAARFERRYVADASEIWFVNEPIAQWHRERYPDKADRIHVVANGFDPEFAPAPRRTPSPPDRPLRFGYIGTVSGRVPLGAFVEGWDLAREREPLLADAEAEIRGYLGFYASRDPSRVALLDRYTDRGVTYGGPVPKAEIASVYESYDVLLLILGAGRYVTSGKAYEYIASALPVVAVHDPGNAATGLFEGHPRWFPVAEVTGEEVARALIAAAHSAREDSPQVIEQAAALGDRFSREHQLAPRIEALSRLVGFQPETGTPEVAA
ncbi:MAG: glycosyltransferase [Motilibacteraceae bacterium]